MAWLRAHRPERARVAASGRNARRSWAHPLDAALLANEVRRVTITAHRSRDIPTGFRYHVSIGGVILSIPQVRIAGGSSHGLIIGAEPHIHFDVRTTARVRARQTPAPVTVSRSTHRWLHVARHPTRALQVFRPVPGLELVGVVKQARASCPPGGAARREFEGICLAGFGDTFEPARVRTFQCEPALARALTSAFEHSAYRRHGPRSRRPSSRVRWAENLSSSRRRTPGRLPRGGSGGSEGGLTHACVARC